MLKNIVKFEEILNSLAKLPLAQRISTEFHDGSFFYDVLVVTLIDITKLEGTESKEKSFVNRFKKIQS
jgi:hypothetical protein